MTPRILKMKLRSLDFQDKKLKLMIVGMVFFLQLDLLISLDFKKNNLCIYHPMNFPFLMKSLKISLVKISIVIGLKLYKALLFKKLSNKKNINDSYTN